MFDQFSVVFSLLSVSLSVGEPNIEAKLFVKEKWNRIVPVPASSVQRKVKTATECTQVCLSRKRCEAFSLALLGPNLSGPFLCTAMDFAVNVYGWIGRGHFSGTYSIPLTLYRIPYTAFAGSIRVDFGTLYVDGKQVTPNNKPLDNTLDHHSFSACTKVITIKARRSGHNSGIIGAFSNGLLTDDTWRCTDSEEAGWTSPSFDDTKWPQAAIVKTTSGHKGLIASGSKLIWSSKKSLVSYCRRRISFNPSCP